MQHLLVGYLVKTRQSPSRYPIFTDGQILIRRQYDATFTRTLLVENKTITFKISNHHPSTGIDMNTISGHSVASIHISISRLNNRKVQYLSMSNILFGDNMVQHLLVAY